MEVARQLTAFGAKMTGLEQYAIAKFAEALEVVPRTIAENSGEGLGRGTQLRIQVDGSGGGAFNHCGEFGFR